MAFGLLDRIQKQQTNGLSIEATHPIIGVGLSLFVGQLADDRQPQQVLTSCAQGLAPTLENPKVARWPASVHRQSARLAVSFSSGIL